MFSVMFQFTGDKGFRQNSLLLALKKNNATQFQLYAKALNKQEVHVDVNRGSVAEPEPQHFGGAGSVTRCGSSSKLNI
jgi:hypothetical protein